MAYMKPLDSLKTMRECALKLLEEASEACEAIKRYDKSKDSVAGEFSLTYREALLELADVEQCVCNCLHAIGARQEDWKYAVFTVRERNAKRGRHEVEDAGELTMNWVIIHDL